MERKDPIRLFVERHAALREQHPEAIFQLTCDERNEWKAVIYSTNLEWEGVETLACGFGDSADTACASALLSEGGRA